MEYFAVFIVFLLIFVLCYIMLNNIFNKKINIEERINDIKDIGTKTGSEEIKTSFSKRALYPLYKAFTNSFLRLTPNRKFDAFNKKLEKAGLVKNKEGENWLFKKNMISIVFSSLIGLFAYSLRHSIVISFFMTLLFMMFINIVFNFYVSRRIEIRKENILKDLPFTIDLITVSVEAGLSFDGAMERVISNIKGEICDEFAKCLKEMRMGIDRKIALKNLSNRCDVKELSILVTSIIQADELGVSLGKVLRIESNNLREHRKQVAREKAMKAPIKMLFPLILFIFPSVFVIILGPAVIKIMDVFSKKG